MQDSISMLSCGVRVGSHFTANIKALLQKVVHFRQDKFT